MASFRLSLLGEFQLSAPAGHVVPVVGKKNRALLAVLALSPGQTATRERLATLLWGERGEEQARNSLRQSLAVLRKELGADGSRLIVSRDEALTLRIEDAAIDVTAIAAGTSSDDVVVLRDLAGRCRGELLADIIMHGESFEEWIAAERSSFGLVRTQLLERLAELETGQMRVAAAQRLVDFDPLRESSQRLLMRAYSDAGNDALALKQYQRCQELLNRELNIEPAKETQELRRQIAGVGRVEGASAPKREEIHADPLYLSTLASLGQAVRSDVLATLSKDSIAVLPFSSISDEPGQEFFADGLTEDIITDLSNVPGLFVIARNSTLAYKGKPTDVRQIAQDLGVNFILEGSARRSDARLRVNVQLSSAAEGGRQVWAERFDRQLTDFFEVQDEIARRVVDAIRGKIGGLPTPERSRPSNLEAYDLCVRGRNLWYVSKAANDEARVLLERAISLDPDYCEAHWQLANSLIFGWQLWGDAQEPSHRNALALARRAVEIDPSDATAHITLGYMLLYDRRWADAELEYDAAVRLGSGDAHVFADVAYFHVMNGRPHDALAAAAKALRLNPRPSGWYFWITGTALVASRQYENAVTTLRREETYRSASRRMLAAALALLGRDSEARAEATLFLAASPHWRISKWAEEQPFKNAADAEFWVSAFRRAGLPE